MVGFLVVPDQLLDLFVGLHHEFGVTIIAPFTQYGLSSDEVFVSGKTSFCYIQRFCLQLKHCYFRCYRSQNHQGAARRWSHHSGATRRSHRGGATRGSQWSESPGGATRAEDCQEFSHQGTGLPPGGASRADSPGRRTVFAGPLQTFVAQGMRLEKKMFQV